MKTDPPVSLEDEEIAGADMDPPGCLFAAKAENHADME